MGYLLIYTLLLAIISQMQTLVITYTLTKVGMCVQNTPCFIFFHHFVGITVVLYCA